MRQLTWPRLTTALTLGIAALVTPGLSTSAAVAPSATFATAERATQVGSPSVGGSGSAQSLSVTIPKAAFAEPRIHEGHVTITAVLTGRSSEGELIVQVRGQQCRARIRSGHPTQCTVALTSPHPRLQATINGTDFRLAQSWQL